MAIDNAGACPIDHGADAATPIDGASARPDSLLSEAEMRDYLFHWYRNTGMRGCLFNKVAAQRAQEGSFVWETPVEHAGIDEIVQDEAGERVLSVFDEILESTDKQALVSFIFPGIKEPRELGDLLKFLVHMRPDQFTILPEVDRVTGFFDTQTGDSEEYVGIQFRIILGHTAAGEPIYSYPMIYNPWPFTTFARNFDYPMITFNRHNMKSNPETSETFIGVDDIDLGLGSVVFDAMLDRSIRFNTIAHGATGSRDDTEHFSRSLFRAHNALVLPASAWDD